MIHYIFGEGPSPRFQVTTTSPLAGQVKNLSDIHVALTILSEEFKIVELNLCDGVSGDLILAFGAPKQGKLSFDLALVKKFDRLKVVKLMATFEDGKKRVICALALTKLRSTPDVTFVVGSPRSGTTAVGNSLQQAYGVKSHGESHVADVIAALVEQSNNHFSKSKAAANNGTLTQATQAVHMEALIYENLRDIHGSFYGDKIILDKTPGIPMIKALPILLRAYPNAKVVFCKRRGLENVASRMKKFPKVSFLNHCKQWRNAFNSWEDAKKQVIEQIKKKDCFIELEQFNLLQKRAEESKRLADFLSMNKKQTSRIEDYLANNSPQKTSTDRSAKAFDDFGWTTEQQATFKSMCGKVMKRKKYSYDESYFQANV